MPGRAYADFDLRIERAEGGYRTWAESSLAGEADASFQLPPELTPFTSPRNRSYRGRDPRRPSKKTDLRGFGRQLFRALFREGVEICFRESLAQAAAQDLGLRLRLRLNGVPELARLPWEYLCDPAGDFLALSESTPIVRYPDLALRRSPLAAAPPIRMLVLIASPPGLPALNGAEEMRHIERALARLVERGRVVLERVEPPTLPELLVRLRRERCPIFHFIGHGTFDPEAGEGALAFEDGEGGTVRVAGRDLGAVLHRRKVSLAVLNTCEGARHDESDALAGVAQALLRRGIPAVVAMQSVVSDGAAVSFARHFYQLLAEGYPVDGGLSEARLAMFSEGHATEWGTPVLYLRAAEGHLFAAPGEPPPSRWWRWRGGLTSLRSPLVWGPVALLLVSGYAVRQFVTKAVPSAPRPAPARQAEPRVVPPPVTFLGLAPSNPSPAVSSPPPKISSPKPAVREKAVPGCPSPPGTDLRFVRIEPGEFLMGSNQGDQKPIHKVRITHPFCLGKFEVTERQWRQVMQEEVDPPWQDDDNLPVAASWDEADLFIQKLNQKVGRAIYRLPWEAEWEYSARAGSITRYSFGNDPAQLSRYGNCLSRSEPGDGFQHRAPVGSFKPNHFGLYDMHGNVWEWVGDWYGLYGAGPATDPTGPPTGDKRVRRGGGFEAKASNCESSVRRSSPPNFKRAGYTGFRLLQILP